MSGARIPLGRDRRRDGSCSFVRTEGFCFSIEKYGKKHTIMRLNIILNLKEAYLRTMGQPIGFDFSRINCYVGKETVTVDMKLQSVYIKCE